MRPARHLLLAFWVLWAGQLHAQSAEKFVSLGYGYAPVLALHLASLDVYQAWSLRPESRLMLGLGARYNYQGGTEAVGFAGVARETDAPERVDIAGVDVHSVALFGEITYRFTPRLEAGFNIELIGFAFGTDREGIADGGETIALEPEPFSLLLVGTNDLGSLNSEFFVAYKMSDRVWLRANLSHTVVNYLPIGPEETETRYQRFFDYPTLGVQFQL
jgi:hypothetical protein